MQHTKKILIAGLVLGSLAFGAISAAAQGLPEGEGKQAIQESCNLCHGLGYITQSSRSEGEWKDLLSDMVSRGAPLTKDEFGKVLKYLATNFGPKSASESKKSNLKEETPDAGTTP